MAFSTAHTFARAADLAKLSLFNKCRVKRSLCSGLCL